MMILSVSPVRFARYALATSAVWLLCIYPLLNYFAWDHLSSRARSSGSDFSQYYSGALAVRFGMKECLYPQPNMSLYSAPPVFRPLVSTPLFNPTTDSSRMGNWAFYPQIADPNASLVAPKLTAKCHELQDDYHYIYPPPLALLLVPLSLLDYDTACRAVWFPLMCASLFGISYYSSKICSLLFSKPTYIEGVSALLPAVPTWLMSGLGTTLYVGNVSPLIGFLIAIVAYSLATNRQTLIACGIIPLILFKGIGLTWCPLLIMGGMKKKAICLMVLLTLALNALAVYMGGPGLYQTFFRDILPKASIPLGIGIPGMLMRILGVDAGVIPTIIKLGLLSTIYYYHHRACEKRFDRKLVTLTTIIATMAVFNLLNPVVWPHYFTCYLILPFAPWIIREIMISKGRTKVLLTVIMLTTVLGWLDSLFLVKESLLVGTLSRLNLYFPMVDLGRKTLSMISFYVIPNAVTVLILILALRRLMICSVNSPRETATDLGHNLGALES